MRRALALVLVVPALALLAAGCADTPQTGGDSAPRITPVRLAAILPTANGLTDATPSRAADADAVQSALAGPGKADAGAARKLTELGLKRGAIRTWTAPGGGRMSVVVSEWGDHFAATSVGGDAAEIPLGTSGAHAWTPSQLGASRGVRVDTPGSRLQTLSYAIDTTDLFVRAEGPIPQSVVIRAVQRMAAALGGGEAPQG